METIWYEMKYIRTVHIWWVFFFLEISIYGRLSEVNFRVKTTVDHLCFLPGNGGEVHTRVTYTHEKMYT